MTSVRAFLERPDATRRLGPFHLVRALGRGGFAPVWLAREVYGGVELRTVAVKLFAFDAASGVIEEARLLSSLDHPNVVRYHRLVDDEPGLIGLVMEYVEGRSLEARLDDDTKLPLAEVLAAAAAVASALSAVHRAGLVHRDVKPANIVEAGGTTKLIDFGVASSERGAGGVVDELPLDGAATSSSGGASGTTGYMDPECVASGAVAAPASDLYALGATIFECITGSLPSARAADEGGGLDPRVLEGGRRAPSLAAVDPSVPRALAALVDALLDPKQGGRPASAERVAIELERLRRELAGKAKALPPEDVGPFRGLGRFEPDDRDVFFGRSPEIAAVLERLRARGLVALAGESGSGKSSLALAGVAPLVGEGALGGWVRAYDVCVAVPGADPVGAILAALGDRVPAAASPSSIASTLAARAERDGRGTLLVIDALEELVTRAPPEAAARAADLLERLSDPMLPGVRVLVTLRRDLLDPLLTVGGLGGVLSRGLVLVAPMGLAAWGDAIEQALEAYGYAFEDAPLRAELMAQLGATVSAMPLVQFALTELWKHRDKKAKRVTWEALRAIGGVAGALERHADATLARIDARPLVQRLLLALTTPRGTRRVAKLDELLALGPAVPDALAKLEEARLVVRDEDGITLAHEVLLTRWATLRGWVADAADERILADEIEVDARRWSIERDDGLLWKRARLAEAAALLDRDGALSSDARDFVGRARRVERRRRRLGWAIGATAAALAVTGLVVTLRAADARARDREVRRACGRLVETGSVAALSQDPKTLDGALHSPLFSADIRFDAVATPLPDDRFHYEVEPVGMSIPGGLSGVSAVSYNMNHKSFANPVLRVTREDGFRAAYDGWGCVTRVVVLIELTDPERLPIVASFDLCKAIAAPRKR